MAAGASVAAEMRPLTRGQRLTRGVMLAVSFALLLAINVLQRWSARRLGTA